MVSAFGKTVFIRAKSESMHSSPLGWAERVRGFILRGAENTLLSAPPRLENCSFSLRSWLKAPPPVSALGELKYVCFQPLQGWLSPLQRLKALRVPSLGRAESRGLKPPPLLIVLDTLYPQWLGSLVLAFNRFGPADASESD
jgi:hypothetical protein